MESADRARASARPSSVGGCPSALFDRVRQWDCGGLRFWAAGISLGMPGPVGGLDSGGSATESKQSNRLIAFSDSPGLAGAASSLPGLHLGVAAAGQRL